MAKEKLTKLLAIQGLAGLLICGIEKEEAEKLLKKAELGIIDEICDMPESELIYQLKKHSELYGSGFSEFPINSNNQSLYNTYKNKGAE